MIRLNVHDAKTHLSRHLDALAQGESIVLCRRNVPIAKIHPLPPARREPRPIGLHEGEVGFAPNCFEPLPADELAFWDGGPLAEHGT